MPTDAEYEASLRNAVREHYANPEEEATVRSMRTKSEQDLGLDEGFYKNDDTWKDRSKQTIQDQFQKCETEQAEKTEEVVEEKKSLKRASPSTNSRPRKKSKLEEEEESTALSEPPESSVEEDSAEEEDYAPKKKTARKPPAKTAKSAAKSKPAPSKKTKATKAKKDSSTSELSDAPSHDLSEPPEDAVPSKVDKDDAADDTSSELSSVIDEPQPSRKSSKSKNGSVSKSSTSKSKSKAPAESDPKAEEIKRLQGWLVKCGIRKVWGKELKPFTTQNAKISHLKSMLSDAGMTGRFSNEKAAQIKEARELAADIEAVQEGNERWGKDGEDDEEEAERGGRRLVRGAKNYAFLSSDGEEESD